ncbi:protein of unknown function [Aerococcus urinaehominis]|nr:sulfatase-like hydrolase/transferase [Aerococcus urinaehominis]SDM15597.1 protein of unknown function [Aerococcus urinaehominis]
MHNKALEVMDEFIAKDEPFFLYYPSHLVHGPILPHERFRGTSGFGDYGDFVLQLDSYVGELADKLKQAGIYDNTIFIFTSDNGASSIIDIPKMQEQGHDPSNGLRGHKMHIWEGGHREPTIVSYPNLIPAGTTSNQMISHSDFYATIAEILEADLADNVAEDSYSNLALWQGNDQAVRQDIIHSAVNGGFSIRRDFWKLNVVKDGGMKMDYQREIEDYKEVFQPAELYDLRDDLSETNNVIADHPEVVEELMAALEEAILAGRTTPGENQANQPDLPTGDWEQVAFLSNYEEYVKSLNDKAIADGLVDQKTLDTKPKVTKARGI